MRAGAIIAATQAGNGNGWPVTDSLHFLGYADNANNTFDDPTHMSLLFDESGNGRHATTASSGEAWEAAGSSEGKACLRCAGIRLRYNGGTELTSSRFSIFCVIQGSQLMVATGNNAGGEIALVWTDNNNSPLIRNNANGTVVGGASPLTYFTDYSDQVSRSFVFNYDDAANVRTVFVQGVKTNEDGDTGWTGTPAGAFDIYWVMAASEIVTLRLSMLAVYEDKLLTAGEVSDLHSYVKDTLGLVA